MAATLETRPAAVKVIASKLEQPDLDNRSYRVIELPNRLEVLLVHDPDTDKASAAMDVHVGNYCDSDDLQVCDACWTSGTSDHVSVDHGWCGLRTSDFGWGI